MKIGRPKPWGNITGTLTIGEHNPGIVFKQKKSRTFERDYFYETNSFCESL
jgi:hypothetical protein